VKPFWITSGCSAVALLPSEGGLLTGAGGSCTQLLSGGGGPPTAGGREQHLETQEKRGFGNFGVGIKGTLYLKA